jgi:hypothetical protein
VFVSVFCSQSLFYRYRYTEEYARVYNRPAVWMPRGSELVRHGRSDLKQAMERHWGGVDRVTRLAGMVPYVEWHYLDGQLHLMTLLRQYLRENHSNTTASKDIVFPKVLDIQRNGYDELHDLIRYYGGRTMVASRLGMALSTRKYSSRTRDEYALQLRWGKFDLDFGIDLLTYVREYHTRRSPPLRNPVIAMPTNLQLMQSPQGQTLHQRMTLYGGYENVARRLGLAYDFSSSSP